MTIETIAFLGLVFIMTGLAAMVCERRMDVLYGSYIEGRTAGSGLLSIERLWTPVRSGFDRGFLLPQNILRLRWKAREMIYLASVIAC